MKKLLMGLAVLVVVLAGCGIREGLGTGSLTVTLGAEYAKSIIPPIDMAVVEYVIEGTGPGSASFGPMTVTGTTTFDALLPGSWTVTAVGQNADHVAIGEGSGSTTIAIGQVAQLTITVTEYSSPNGSLRMDLAWEPDIVNYPVMLGNLKDFAGVETAQPFTLDEVLCTATNTTTELHPGWYAEVVRLFDAPSGLDGSEVLSTGFAEAVRIAAGQQTAGNVFMHAVQSFGGIEIYFEPDFSDPLALIPSPAFGSATVYAGTPLVLTCAADQAATFVWYLRGQQVGIGDSYTLDPAGLTIGETYRLDVLAFSIDGRHGASGTWNLLRADMPELYEIIGGVYTIDHLGTELSVELVDTGTFNRVAILHPAPDAPPAQGYSTSFDFIGLPVGSYYLRAWYGNPGQAYPGLCGAYWGPTLHTLPTAATVIAVPVAAPGPFSAGFPLAFDGTNW